MNIILIISSVILSGLSQILLKIWVDSISFNNKTYIEIFLELIKNYWILLGFLSIWVSMIMWLKVLSQNDVSFAYPFVAISFIFVLIVSYFFLEESINIYKVVEKGILPQINTGIAHKDPGVGQVGAGLVNPPAECFEKALEAFVEKYEK